MHLLRLILIARLALVIVAVLFLFWPSKETALAAKELTWSISFSLPASGPFNPGTLNIATRYGSTFMELAR
jgi:hypothetical protein